MFPPFLVVTNIYHIVVWSIDNKTQTYQPACILRCSHTFWHQSMLVRSVTKNYAKKLLMPNACNFNCASAVLISNSMRLQRVAKNKRRWVWTITAPDWSPAFNQTSEDDWQIGNVILTSTLRLSFSLKLPNVTQSGWFSQLICKGNQAGVDVKNLSSVLGSIKLQKLKP